MVFRKVLALRGPNIWAHFPVLEAWVDLLDLQDARSDEIPGFTARLTAWLSGWDAHRCLVGRGTLREQLGRGTDLAHALEHVTLELQALAGVDVRFGRTRETSTQGVSRVVVQYEEETLGRAGLEAARRLCLAAVHDQPFDLAAEVEALRELAGDVDLGPGLRAIVRAAEARGIPVRRLDLGSLVQLGQGARQRRFRTAETDRTGALAEAIAQDKELTKELLRAVGVPVPEGHGLPGERLAPGAEHRLLVVGGRVVAATRVNPAEVTDDFFHRPPSTVHRPQPVIDVTDQVHPEVAAWAIDAARVVGLDIAGVDVVAQEIGRPLEEQGGVVVEVNAAPGLRMHLEPSVGRPRPVGEAIVGSLFPAGQDGRIPLVAVTGVNGKTTVTRLIAHLLKQDGPCVGMTCTDGIYINGRRIAAGDCSGPRSAQAVLMNPKVEAAVLETARGGILRAGLGFDRCDVAVVTNIGEGDHLGLSEVETLEDLARVKRTVVEVVLPQGAAVLKADDPLTAAMAPHCPGRIIFFARDGGHPVLAAHRARGGRVVFVHHEAIVRAEGSCQEVLAPLSRVPLTLGGRIGFQVENALAATAAAWALDLCPETIRAGLASFHNDLEKVPGRFNLLEIGGATVIVDYGHNPSALAALIDALASFPQEHRTVVYSGVGDRRDCDMVRQGGLLGDAFDRVILFEDHYTRGRPDGETTALLRRGLAEGTRVSAVEEVRGAVKAVEVALRAVRPGDLLLVQADVIDETIAFIRRYLSDRSPGPRARLDELGQDPIAAPGLYASPAVDPVR